MTMPKPCSSPINLVTMRRPCPCWTSRWPSPLGMRPLMEQVLRLIALGRSERDIAEELVLSTRP